MLEKEFIIGDFRRPFCLKVDQQNKSNDHYINNLKLMLVLNYYSCISYQYFLNGLINSNYLQE